MTAAIDIDAVSKRYGELKALDAVSFTIEQGEFFGLLGPNGAGKSTLISIIAGLARKDSGHVSVLGHDTVTDYRAARQHLGVVPQELVYDPFFSIEEMLRIQAGYFGKRGPQLELWLDELLDALDLQSKRQSKMRALSGGMKRRVLIAQALVHKPPVLILDEPTAGVDVELRRTLWGFTRRLHEEGHTIVLTTHYLEEAESLCERIAILDHGQLKALESKQDILSRHPYRFVSINVDGEGELPEPLQALRCCADEEQGGAMEFRLHKEQHRIGDLLDGLREAGFKLQDIHTREPSLEDVFVELTGDHA
ncbi:MAG: ABC transporter ATP-binding protein [Oceanococcus sp.]